MHCNAIIVTCSTTYVCRYEHLISSIFGFFVETTYDDTANLKRLTYVRTCMCVKRSIWSHSQHRVVLTHHKNFDVLNALYVYSRFIVVAKLCH